MAEFDRKVALVTGGAEGIGRATALAFARLGARVVVSDIVEPQGQETVRLVREMGGEAVFVHADVTQMDQVAVMVGTTVAYYGQLDLAVNNAGVEGSFARTADYPEEAWRQVIDVNLNGVWYCMKYELDQMLKQGHGTIVNVASVAGLAGFPNHSAYVASKHAVVGLTKTAAIEYIRKGIRINAVCPGFIDTPMVARERVERQEYSQRLVDGTPARRLGQPEEVAAAVLYLCSERAGFVVGHCLVLDGGTTAL